MMKYDEKSSDEYMAFFNLSFGVEGKKPYLLVEVLHNCDNTFTIGVIVQRSYSIKPIFEFYLDLENVNHLTIDGFEIEDNYIFVHLNVGKGNFFTIQVKKEEEGLVLDILKNDEIFEELGYLTEEDFF